jgi:hypothetical protein
VLYFDKIVPGGKMLIDDEIKKIKERQGPRTGIAFIVGAFLGGIFGLDLLIALLAGIVAAIVIWTGYSDEIAKREKERILDGK